MKATFLILAVAAASTIASADTIISVVNTGVNGGGVLAPNTLDPNYTLFLSPVGEGVTANSIPNNPGAYFNDGTNSFITYGGSADWINPAANDQGGTGVTANSTIGLYIYEIQITDSAFTGGTLNWAGVWGTDNCGSIMVDNVATTTTAATGTGTTIGGGATAGGCNGSNSNFQSPTAFNLATTLGSGVNYLQFDVYNLGGPSALIVDGASATPEPSSVISVLTGLGLVAAGIARRRVSK